MGALNYFENPVFSPSLSWALGMAPTILVNIIFLSLVKKNSMCCDFATSRFIFLRTPLSWPIIHTINNNINKLKNFKILIFIKVISSLHIVYTFLKNIYIYINKGFWQNMDIIIFIIVNCYNRLYYNLQPYWFHQFSHNEQNTERGFNYITWRVQGVEKN